MTDNTNTTTQQQAGQQPAAAPQTEAARQQQQQGRPCPRDCRKCPMAQQICCASMLSFQMYDVMSVVIRRLDMQAERIDELSKRLEAIQSPEAELSSPTPMDTSGFKV